MRCYHCIREPKAGRTLFGIAEAVGVCQQWGEAVCKQHAVKSDFPLPETSEALAGAPKAGGWIRNVFLGWRVVVTSAIINGYGAGVQFYGFSVFFNPMLHDFG